MFALFLIFNVFLRIKPTGDAFSSVLNSCCMKTCIVDYSCSNNAYGDISSGSSDCTVKGTKNSCGSECMPSIPAGCSYDSIRCSNSLYDCGADNSRSLV